MSAGGMMLSDCAFPGCPRATDSAAARWCHYHRSDPVGRAIRRAFEAGLSVSTQERSRARAIEAERDRLRELLQGARNRLETATDIIEDQAIAVDEEDLDDARGYVSLINAALGV